MLLDQLVSNDVRSSKKKEKKGGGLMVVSLQRIASIELLLRFIKSHMRKLHGST